MSFVADSVRIGILGDFQPKAPNLPAIEKSLQHASSKLQIAVASRRRTSSPCTNLLT